MAESSTTRTVRVCTNIGEVPAQKWNNLVGNNYPFLQHGVLSAMEEYGCVGDHVGWVPRHLAYYDGDDLIAALPLYEKTNSWGEFVFDHAWADAYERYGMAYYPKLLNAIPFTPATGQRILARRDRRDESAATLNAAATKLVVENGYSGIHSLFPSDTDFDTLKNSDWVSRNDCQFHWFNLGYENFDEFLSTLKSKKRKNIRRERKTVRDSGITIERLNGHTATNEHWVHFTRLYERIYDRKYGMPAFNHSYFEKIAKIIPDNLLLVMAHKDNSYVAGALMYLDDETLYGRHWGCDQFVDCLHFELCYYQGIDYCIANGLKKFDPGAQGEHKIARGFVPTRTRSLHWMAPSPFNDAIRQFVIREQQGVSRYIDLVHEHSPYSQSAQ